MKMIIDTVRGMGGGVEAELLYGTVAAVSPMQIRVDERLTIEGERICWRHWLQKRRMILRHEAGEHTFEREYLLEKGPEVGDRVILLRLGEDWLVCGRVGEEGEAEAVE